MKERESFVTRKTILITGSTDGIGKETARRLAALGARVVLHGRNGDKLKATQREMIHNTGNRQIHAILADLSEIAQVEELAAEVGRRFPKIKVLINNAGTYQQSQRLTRDAIEETFAVNYMAPFLLSLRLARLLGSNAPSRIVNVCSRLHEGADLDFINLETQTEYDGHEAYASSKLALAMFSAELAERLRNTGVTVNFLHPGGVNTKLLRSGFGAWGVSPERGADVSVFLASTPDLKTTGGYFTPMGLAEPDPRVGRAILRRELWDYTERLLVSCGHAHLSRKAA